MQPGGHISLPQIVECGETGHNPPTVEGDTSCLNVSYGLVFAKSLGTSKIVDLGVLIYRYKRCCE